jgi:hypothetical protein
MGERGSGGAMKVAETRMSCSARAAVDELQSMSCSADVRMLICASIVLEHVQECRLSGIVEPEEENFR